MIIFSCWAVTTMQATSWCCPRVALRLTTYIVWATVSVMSLGPNYGRDISLHYKGKLRLSLSKEYYEKAGLVGKPARFGGRKGQRWCACAFQSPLCSCWLNWVDSGGVRLTEWQNDAWEQGIGTYCVEFHESINRPHHLLILRPLPAWVFP